MGLRNNDKLRLEIFYFHEILFKRAPSNDLVDGYLQAHSEIEALNHANLAQAQTIETIIVKRLNPLGIEPWIRQKNRRHLISSKLLLILYLSECDACHNEFHRNILKTKFPIFTIIYVTIAAGLTLSVGFIKTKWHGLV